MNFNLIDRTGLRDPSERALWRGELQVLPAEFWAGYTQTEISLFCCLNAIYCIPTVELVHYLGQCIGGRKAIEIGAGSGVLAKALGIPATDNFMQDNADIRAHYRLLNQPTIRYGAQVKKLHAIAAVRKYEPEVVIGAWVTHKFIPGEAWREGNMYGIDENEVVRRAEYINIGHTSVHGQKPIWGLEHKIEFPPWLVSRALTEGENYIARWVK